MFQSCDALRAAGCGIAGEEPGNEANFTSGNGFITVVCLMQCMHEPKHGGLMHLASPYATTTGC